MNPNAIQILARTKNRNLLAQKRINQAVVLGYSLGGCRDNRCNIRLSFVYSYCSRGCENFSGGHTLGERISSGCDLLDFHRFRFESKLCVFAFLYFFDILTVVEIKNAEIVKAFKQKNKHWLKNRNFME